MAEAQLDESQVSEETEFETAFAEFAEKDQPEESELEEQPQDKKSDAEESEEETKAEGEEKPAAEEVDPYAGMSDEVKEQFITLEKDKEDLQHRLKSDAGRVSAFQRQINILTDTVDNLRADSKPEDRPSDKQIADAMKGTDDDWDEFKQDYPTVAEAIDRRFEKFGESAQEAIDNTLKPVTSRLDEVVESNQAEAADNKAAEVAEVYPTWQEAVAKPEFTEWLNDQSPGVTALAGSDDTKDATTLLRLYDEHLVSGGKDSLKAPDPTEPGVKDKEEEAQGGAEPTELQKRRAQQLEDGTAIPSKGAGIDPDGGQSGTEFEQAFEFFAKKKQAQRTA